MMLIKVGTGNSADPMVPIVSALITGSVLLAVWTKVLLVASAVKVPTTYLPKPVVLPALLPPPAAMDGLPEMVLVLGSLPQM